MSFRAVLLAGGLGTRFHPLTEALPKPMLEVAGRPWLERLVRDLDRQGFEEIVLSLRHCNDVVVSHFGDGSGYRARLRYAVEPVPLGTGGAIRFAAHPAPDTVVVLNADVVQTFDLRAFVDFHRARRADVTIGLVEVADPAGYGAVEADPDGRVRRFLEKPQPGETASRLVNAGVYAFEPALLAQIPTGREVSVERDTFPALLASGARVFGYRCEGYWRDIGTRDRYLALHRDILAGRCPIAPDWPAASRGIWLGPEVELAPHARVVPPVALGPGTAVAEGARVGPYVFCGAGCRFGPGSRVRDTVLWEGVRVGGAARLVRSIIGHHARVGGGALRAALVAAGGR